MVGWSARNSDLRVQIDGHLLDVLISLNADEATIQESGGRD
jgi:hypothetical protein